MQSIDSDKRTVTLQGDKQALTYDRLILSPGIDFIWDQLPGMQPADARDKILHAWKAGPQTLLLMGVAVLASILIAVPLGVYQAYKRNLTFDRVANIGVFLAWSMPTFWFGTMLIALFAVTLHWLPTQGFPLDGWDEPGRAFASLVLPALTIGVEETFPRSFATGIPLSREAAFSAASERMISPTVRGFVARLWIWPPPCGVNGWPRKTSASAS